MSTPTWVIVYTGGAAETGVLRDLLIAAGIDARLGDEVMGTIAPYIVGAGAVAAIKVLVPEDRVADAAGVVAEFTGQAADASAAAAPTSQPWECPCCHEQNDGTFDICWNCQSERTGEGR